MKKNGKRYREEQIIYALREVQGGRKIAAVCRELGVTEQTYHRLKRKYAGMGVTELRRLKQLPQLETLWLTNCIVPEGYAVLKELKQLRELTMTMCNITDQELESLEEALPEARISHMTGGGSWTPKRIRERNKTTQAVRAPKSVAEIDGAEQPNARVPASEPEGPAKAEVEAK